jgi:4-amino-4-deoxy-L-arabinose transferase-like glycosyltransferase
MTGWPCCSSFAVALFLRTYLLETDLPAMHGDEGEMGELARNVLYGPGDGRGALPLPYFRTGFLDHPTFFHFLQAGALILLGDDILSLKLLSALFGALCAPAIYVIGRVGWGRGAGLVAAWLLAVSHLHIQFSRIALNNIETVWFTIVFIMLVILVDALGPVPARAPAAAAEDTTTMCLTADADSAAPPVQAGLPDRRLMLFVLIGLTVGLSQYFYYGSRLIALLALPLLLLLWLTHRATLRDLAVSATAAVAVYLPLLYFYTSNLPSFLNRTRGVSVFSQEGMQHVLGPSAAWPADWWPLLLVQVQRNAEFFIASGDRSAFYMPEFPAFDPVTVALFWLGLGVLVVQWRRFPGQATLLWLGLGVLLGGVATNDAPNAPRLIVAVPAVFVVAGAAVQKLFDVLGAVWPRGLRWAAGLAVALLFAVTLQANYTIYFERYAQIQPYAGWSVMSRMMVEHAATHRSVMLGEPILFVEHGTIRFIAADAARANLFSVDEFPQQVALAAENGQGVLLIALTHHLNELAAIKQQYPGGESGEYYDALDRLVFAYYRLPP